MTETCDECGGTGTLDEYVCCGQYLETGECCATIYGSANLMLEYEECPYCGGSGEIETT